MGFVKLTQSHAVMHKLQAAGLRVFATVSFQIGFCLSDGGQQCSCRLDCTVLKSCRQSCRWHCTGTAMAGQGRAGILSRLSNVKFVMGRYATVAKNTAV
jgi:hypothetical protein